MAKVREIRVGDVVRFPEDKKSMRVDKVEHKKCHPNKTHLNKSICVDSEAEIEIA